MNKINKQITLLDNWIIKLVCGEIINLISTSKSYDKIREEFFHSDELERNRFLFSKINGYDFIMNDYNIVILDNYGDVDDKILDNPHYIYSCVLIDNHLNAALVDFYDDKVKSYKIEKYINHISVILSRQDMINGIGGKRGYYRCNESLSIRTKEYFFKKFPQINKEEGREEFLTKSRFEIFGKVNNIR